MKSLKKLFVLLTFSAVACLQPPSLSAAEYVTDTGGCGYQQCRKCPSIAPAVALGTIALVAIVAVALQNQSNGHAHAHSKDK